VAVLTAPDTVSPNFTPDVAGEYVVHLIVSDGVLTSAVDVVVVVAAFPNAAPTANAGPDQTIPKNTQVILDGSASFDPDGDPITYLWSFVALPQGSTAVLTGADTPAPTFMADRGGDYVVRLTVNDGQVDSTPDTVVTVSVNDPAVADAGPDQSVRTGVEVALDGGASNAATPTPTFTPDLLGTYLIQLRVNDGESDSAPDELQVDTRSIPTILQVTPNSGPMGTPVTIEGEDFDPEAADNQVIFNGTPAVVTSATETRITTTVPQGATSGLRVLTTTQGSDSRDFTVPPPAPTLH
jgi:hypothetical protein